MGFKFLKMDVGIGMLEGTEDALVAPPDMLGTHEIMHPFTGIQITDKGIGLLCQYVADVRDEMGYEGATGGRSLRACWRRIVYSFGQGAGSVFAGVVRGYGTLAVSRAVAALGRSCRCANLRGRGYLTQRGL